jgi:hypothetical protein
VKIDPAQAEATKQLIGTQTAGSFQFQPPWDLVTREEPDLVE